MPSTTRATCDHQTIRHWAEQRGAHPARVRNTGDGDVGLLRLDFPGYEGERLEAIGWDEFFEKFEQKGLCLIFQDETANGEPSNFNKIVSRDSAEAKGA